MMQTTLSIHAPQTDGEQTSPRYSPRSPTCGYCSGDGRLFVARDGEFRCRDCNGIYTDDIRDTYFIPLPSTDTPWPAPRPLEQGPMTLRRAWIHRRFLSK